MAVEKSISVVQSSKVHIFWEDHKILRNLLLTFVLCSASQKSGEDFAKLCSLMTNDVDSSNDVWTSTSMYCTSDKIAWSSF